MKTIILFRHGKSDWKANFYQDLDRPVSNRGIKAAKLMGIYLHEINNIPDLVISSPAVRAYDTAQLAISSGEWNRKLNLDQNLYGATPEIVMNILCNQDDKYDSICITAHEPTMSLFINKYTDSGYQKFPTATMARIDFFTNNWCNVARSKINLFFHSVQEECR